MKILSGKHRGREYISPEGDETTRPMLKRVKKSLFDRLRAAGRLEDAVVMDIFSGTGTMGLEAISCGAKHVVCVERDRQAAGRLKQNFKNLGEEGNWDLLATNCLTPTFIDKLYLLDPPLPLTLLFWDPPYKLVRTQMGLEQLRDQIDRLTSLCDPSAVMIYRVPVEVDILLPETWVETDCWTFGKMKVYQLERPEAAAAREEEAARYKEAYDNDEIYDEDFDEAVDEISEDDDK